MIWKIWRGRTELSAKVELPRVVNQGEHPGSLLLHPGGVRPGLTVDELVSLASPDHSQQPVIPPGNPTRLCEPGPGQSIVQILADMLVGPVEPFTGKGSLSQPVVSNRSRRPGVNPLGGFLESVQGLLASSGSQEREASDSLIPGVALRELLGELEDLFPIGARIGSKGCGSDLIEGRSVVAGGVLAKHFLAEPFVGDRFTALKLQDGNSVPCAEPLVPLPSRVCKPAGSISYALLKAAAASSQRASLPYP